MLETSALVVQVPRVAAVGPPLGSAPQSAARPTRAAKGRRRHATQLRRVPLIDVLKVLAHQLSWILFERLTGYGHWFVAEFQR